MTTLHKAAQQALDWLYDNDVVHPTKVSEDLRAALAQQEEPKGGGRLPPPLQAEPVTEDMKSAVRWAPSSAYWSERLREFFGPDAREGIDALERRIAGAQEPVAWIHTDPDKPRVRFLEWREDEPGYRGRWVKTPLYLAPPQRKPLTDEEIVRIFETPELAGTHFQTPTIKAIAVARAIERAHGIGGQP
jgi:hypothetical protein